LQRQLALQKKRKKKKTDQKQADKRADGLSKRA
jgi:hypothetical protein